MYLLTNVINMLLIEHNQHFPSTERPPSDAIVKRHAHAQFNSMWLD